MARIFITLNDQEKDALCRLADLEFRDPRAQAALIIRKSLEKRGLLLELNRSETHHYDFIPEPQGATNAD